jgi:magnesium transporter
MKRTIVSLENSSWQWIDLENPTKAELQELAAEYGLHGSSVIDSLQPEHLPKYEQIGNINFMITRIYDTQADIEADTIQELTDKVAIFFSQNFIITIHVKPAEVIKEVEHKFILTGQVKAPIELLARLIKAIFKTFQGPAHKLAEELDYYEEQTFLNNVMPPLTKGLYHLKRKAAVSKRVLQLSEVILGNLQLQGIQPTDLQDLRDLYVHLVTLYDEVNDSTNNLINIYISLSSQRTNEVVRVLTIFSVFFLPLTFIVGIYGMNFEYMPELKEKYGYPGVMVAMALVTFIIYLWFRKKRWL